MNKAFWTAALLLLAISTTLHAEGRDKAKQSDELFLSGKLVPGGMNNIQYLYVFGPNGLAIAGKEDSLQINFYRVPASSAEPVTIHIHDAGSTGPADVRGVWPGRETETSYHVLGGKGCYSDPASQEKRPLSNQPGVELASKTFTTDSDERWVQLGPFPLSQGERVGDFVYFKLVAVARKGTRCNYFRTAVSPWNAEAFSFHVSMLMNRQKGEVMSFDVEVQPNMHCLFEHNYDVDFGGRSYLLAEGKTQKLKRSCSAKWVSNLIMLHKESKPYRVRYDTVKGSQKTANSSFFFTDEDGKPMKIFFGSSPRHDQFSQTALQ